MRQKLTTLIGSISFLVVLFIVCTTTVKAQTMEKLILYENFGGVEAGSSVTGIQPAIWPDVHADSNEYCGWWSTDQKLDNSPTQTPIPQFYGNGFFHIDSVEKYRTGGLAGLDITVKGATKEWVRSVPLRNGYTMPFNSATSVDFLFWGTGVLPDLSSWISYGPFVPDFLRNQTDEKGYLYMGKDAASTHPYISFPADLGVTELKDVSKIELMVSGSRVGKNNTVSVIIEELDDFAATLGLDTFTFSASIEPRLVSVPVNKQYCRIIIKTWGDADNGTVTDYELSNNNTEAKVSYSFNTAAFSKNSNPGMSIHMIKIYAMMSGAGYTITTDGALVSGTTSGISYGDEVTLTADADDGSGNKFMGWNIEGQPDLSEVINPLKVTVTEDMTIMPVYVGDEVEVAVVDESFTNWTQKGNTVAAENNKLDYNQGTPVDYFNETIKVPLQYGFTSNGADSVEITLNKCYVIPKYGLRVHNVPGWEDALGYIAFMGPNDNKGYVTVDSLENITKAVVTLSSYDQAKPDRACVLMVNDSIVRNKSLRTLYTEDVTINNELDEPFELQIGPGNQARVEFLENENIDIFSDIPAAAVALHNVKMYAKITVENKNYYQLSTPPVTGGTIIGMVPSAGNSTNHYLDGTKVTLTALANDDYGFDGWEDGIGTSLGLENPITITMDADKTIKPKFAQKYTYVQLIENDKGSVVTSIKPVETSGDILTFYAGVSLNLTATATYGFTFGKWVLNDVDVFDNPLVLQSTDMAGDVTNVISIVYDSITARKSVAIAIDQTKGSITFDHDPENLTTDGDTLRANFPEGESIKVTAKDGYGFEFDKWKSGLDVAVEDTSNETVTVIMDKDIKMATVYNELPRYQLIINTGLHGSLEITDEHKDGTQEQLGYWPEDYRVEITAIPEDGYKLSEVNPAVTWFNVSETVIMVTMDQDPVELTPEFEEKGDFVTFKHNFQDPDLWPMHPDNVSNVPGANEFLKAQGVISNDLNPLDYNLNNIEDLLWILSEYRVWGSADNANSDGPSGTKDPMTTLFLEYEKYTPYDVTIPIMGTQSDLDFTLIGHSTCNDCLIAKAVKQKDENITNRYLGHVTPGMVALRKLEKDGRNATLLPPFIEDDSVSMMIIDGFAVVKEIEIGYVTSSSQFCPGVFYTTNPALEIINSNNLFGDVFGDLWPLGQDFPPAGRPDGNTVVYGWGSAQEGMIMDQGMAPDAPDATDTRVIITNGYKQSGDEYLYSTIYIHDLMIEGIPKTDIGIADLIRSGQYKDYQFYMLGNTNMLQVEINEPVETLVIFDMNGVAVKVYRKKYINNNNQIEIEGLPKGVYGVQCYGESGRLYKGTFGKVND